MKTLLLCICMVPVLAIGQSRKERKAQAKADKETLDNIRKHIEFLADDKLEGRRTGSPGEMLAAQYISTQFAADQLLPKGDQAFTQEFSINEGKQLPADANSFTVNDKALQLNKDYYPLAFSASAATEGASSLSLREKGQPWFFDVADLLEDNKSNPHFNIFDVIAQEVRHTAPKGARALIVFNSGSAIDNIQFNKNDESAAASIPVVYLTHEGLKKYFADPTDYYHLKLTVKLVPTSRKGRNVIGFIDNQAPATVVIGAHFDHLGYGEDNNALDGKGQVHNGADDNASGTAALIELGRLLKNSNAKHNNYLLIAFSGEELGLAGSTYWLAHNTLTPLNYMINLDMVGRYDSSKKLTIGGYGTSPVWGQVLPALSDKNLLVKFDSTGAGPSDHASFYHRNIPVLFFFTNGHSDYHKATDDADKINYTAELDVIKYVQHVVEATDGKGQLPFTRTSEPEVQVVNLPVTLGVMPDYGFNGTGMRIEAVSKGKTAEKIGLKPGDVLLQLGSYKFVDVPTYMQALAKFRKGDTTQLRYRRANVEKTVPVAF
ncbi:M28 family peptidase [Deminuibacter soli]|nr:M28 family peptidase [Deminuibacter soli]